MPLAVAMAAYVFLGTADWWHAWDEDQSDQAAVLHDHTSHRSVVGSKGQAGTGEHCYVCHWLRSLKDGFGRGSVHDLQTADAHGWQPEPANLPSKLAAASIPARAPPAVTA